MPTTLKVYANEDDALLYWNTPAAIPACRGFAIQRRTTDAHGTVTTDVLPNRTGFAGQAVVVGDQTPSRPSTEWPFQRYSWTDHGAKTGDSVSYRVVPVIRNAAGALAMVEAEASEWSALRALQPPPASPFQPHFNRGFVMSQFMEHFLQSRNLTPKQFKDRISDADEAEIRAFLSGDLRTAMLELLAQAKESGGEIYAALFELSDAELLQGLADLGNRAHLVLANGSITKSKEETGAEARQRDENEAARALLVEHGVDVEEQNRFTSPGPLAHNKFLILVDRDGHPVSAWTGSTNWTPTGLCTQINNGLRINDPAMAQVYLDQWKRLRAAGSGFPAELVESNSTAKEVAGHSIWFTRTHNGADMDALVAEVQNAREGILFLMFMPGSAGLFSEVAKRSGEPGLYVRGVVSELPRGRDDESEADINLIDGPRHNPFHLNIVQPEGVDHPMGTFLAEESHRQFIHDIGYAIIHSKVVVIDPFSANPVVITGSHNFSTTASKSNDENFIIIRGDRALAEAYAVNIEGVYAHYRWRAFLNETAQPFNGLQDSDTWQETKLPESQQELHFWGL